MDVIGPGSSGGNDNECGLPLQCKRKTNSAKRKTAVDVMRKFLVDARDESTKNAFSRFKKRIGVAQVGKARAHWSPEETQEAP
jgi:hypothetical protein